MTLLALGFGAVGLVFGVIADRLSTRWPEHDAEEPAGRPIGWRTAVCAGFGALAFTVLATRIPGDRLAVALFGAWFATLILGMATDLDQRLLPNLLTLPVIPVALVFAASGLNPLVGPDLVPALIVATVVPAVLYLLSIPFGAGAFGIGDAKLLVGVGLMTGGIRAFTGLVSGLVAAGVVLAVLLVLHRVTMKSYVAYGPFLIFGAIWGIVVTR